MLIVCIIVHNLWSQWSPSAWVVPNLTVIGLIWAVARAPRSWVRVSVLAGLSQMVWAPGWCGRILLSALALGWAVQQLARRWDVQDLRVQASLVATGSLIGALLPLRLEYRWSLMLIGCVLVQALVTVGALMGLRAAKKIV